MGCGKTSRINDQSTVRRSSTTGKPSKPEPSQQVLHTQPEEDEIKIRPDNFVVQNRASLTDEYTIGEQLGTGSYGSVFQAIHKQTGHKRAIKTIYKKRMQKLLTERKAFLKEVEILKLMDHPNIIKVYEFYEDKKSFHLVTEMCNGGELFHHILETKLNEKIVAKVMLQVLGAITYWHDKKISHRDLKPENLLLSEAPTETDFNIKLVDFGASTLMSNNKKKKLTGMHGTNYYIAPEVLRGEYNEKWDEWSAGIILYVLLSGCPPFDGDNEEEILCAVLSNPLIFPKKRWSDISDEAKHLITKLLDRNPHTRICAKDAVNHPWIQSYCKRTMPETKILSTSIDNLKSFSADSKLQQGVLAFITSQMLSQDETEDLKAAFMAFDTNNDGKLSEEELIAGFEKTMEHEEAVAHVEEIMRAWDTDHSGFIDYNEFLTASMNKKTLLSKQNLEACFNAWDRDGSGKISGSEITSVLGGTKAQEAYWQQLINEFDSNGDGELDIKEFKDLMLKLL